MKHLEGKCNELEINGKNKNIIGLYKGINELKEGYQPWTDLVKDQKGNFHADSYIVLNRWKNHLFQKYWMYFGLMILARLKYIELGHLCVEVEVTIEMLRRYKWPSIDQIAAEFDSSIRWVNAYWNT